MTRLRITTEAEEELAAAAEWYETRQVGLGIELVASVERAFDAILTRPRSFPLWRKERVYRKLLLRTFPYAVIFVVQRDDVVVIAIAHTRRLPGYWMTRARP